MASDARLAAVTAPAGRPLPPSLGKRMQLGYVVADLDAALAFWTGTMGIGPFVVIEDSLGDRQFIHRGQVSPVKSTLAFAYQGDTQYEFIVQSNDAPSPYTEFLAQGREGLHHLAYWPDDYLRACTDLEQAGLEEVCSVRTAEGEKNVSYFSGPIHLGAMVELVPMTPLRMAFYSAIQALSVHWDGSRPVRRFRTRADFFASPDGRAAS